MAATHAARPGGRVQTPLYLRALETNCMWRDGCIRPTTMQSTKLCCTKMSYCIIDPSDRESEVCLNGNSLAVACVGGSVHTYTARTTAEAGSA